MNHNSSFISLEEKESFDLRYHQMIAEDFHFVDERLQREGMHRDTVDQARDEFLQFASLGFATNEEMVPSKLADEYWHTFLLFTQNYHSWCSRHYGKDMFLHHVPGLTPISAWERTKNMMQILHGQDWSSREMAHSCGCKTLLSAN